MVCYRLSPPRAPLFRVRLVWIARTRQLMSNEVSDVDDDDDGPDHQDVIQYKMSLVAGSILLPFFIIWIKIRQLNAVAVV